MENQKNDPSKLMVYRVDVNLNSVLDRYERIVKLNKRLTFALVACASYIVIKNQVAKKVTQITQTAKEQLEKEFKKGE